MRIFEEKSAFLENYWKNLVGAGRNSGFPTRAQLLMKFFDPEGRFILQWNKTFLLCSVIALSLDPLFFYIPIIDGTKRCLDVDTSWR
ncbi:hypothetical protein Lser_V15G15721 [Lactuca serriola]